MEEFPVEKWDLLMDVMLKGTFLMSRAVLPGMRAQGFGRIIHIGSIHASSPRLTNPPTSPPSMRLLGFSKVLALETADADITSNAICPAYLRTPLVDAQIKDQARTRGISEEEVIRSRDARTDAEEGIHHLRGNRRRHRVLDQPAGAQRDRPDDHHRRRLDGAR